MCDSKFTIADVAAIHGIQTLKEGNGEVFAVCPFCGDARGKFSYIIQKGNKSNIYNCFACDAHGGVLDLHINLSYGDYSDAEGRKRAAREIFQEINGNTYIAENHKRLERHVETVVEAERVSNEQCSEVYYALLKELILKDEHKKDLLRRGLTEDDINRFRFKSTPGSEKYKICKKLIADGYSLEGVPGFYINKRGSWDINIPGSGYLCPVFDGEYNLILGFQVRVDDPKNHQKYLWLSSAGKKNGVSSGAVSTFLPGKCINSVVITEGILKATVVYSLLKGTVSVIGVPGVKAIKGIDDYLDRYKGNAYVFEAYDMDKAVKTQDPHELEKTQRIAKAAEALSERVSEFGIDTHPFTWDFDEDGYWKENFKGLDDFLLEYDKKELVSQYMLNLTGENLELKNFFAT